MDPNETLSLLLELSAQANNAPDAEAELADLRDMQDRTVDLIKWLAKGGFAPDWERILREHKATL